jgi:hypothetical protein
VEKEGKIKIKKKLQQKPQPRAKLRPSRTALPDPSIIISFLHFFLPALPPFLSSQQEYDCYLPFSIDPIKSID